MSRGLAPSLVLLVPVLAAVLAGAAPRALAQSQFERYQTATGPAQVVEGDKMTVGGRTVRLYGIDAPELGQTCENRRGRSYNCGDTARAVLAQIVGTRELTCTLYSRVEGNIYVGRCFAGSADIGETMIRRGWAFSYRGVSHRYDVAEAWAQSVRAGMWAGRARRPWVWRQEQPPPQPRRPQNAAGR